jgi:hypothetical protein
MNGFDRYGPIASKLAPTGELWRTRNRHPQQIPCGSELAREGGLESSENPLPVRLP